MTRRKTFTTLCVLSALLGSALAAQSASAATTAFDCAKTTTKTFNNPHCDASGAGNEWGHKAIGGLTLPYSDGPGTFNLGKWILKMALNGIATELVTEGGISGSGTMENTEVGGEMVAKGSGTFTYTKLVVAKPAGKGCKVFTDNEGKAGEEGVVHTNSLSIQTTSAMGLKLIPTTGTVFATFILSGCTGSAALEGLNGTYTINGSVVGEPNGGETKFTHAATTAAETLLINNSIKAGIEGACTDRDLDGGNATVFPTPPYLTDRASSRLSNTSAAGLCPWR